MAWSRLSFFNPFNIFSSCNRKFVVCPFVAKETNGSYMFANGLNRFVHLCRLMGRKALADGWPGGQWPRWGQWTTRKGSGGTEEAEAARSKAGWAERPTGGPGDFLHFAPVDTGLVIFLCPAGLHTTLTRFMQIF